MSDYIPDPWRSAAERRGISPTYRPLASRAKVSHETVRRLIQGRPTTEATVAKVAEALGVDVEKIHEWRGEAPPDYGNAFEPDPSASLLTTEERAVINSLIRLLTEHRREREDEADGNAAPITRAGESPAVEGVRMRARTPSGPLPGSPSQEPPPPRRRGARR